MLKASKIKTIHFILGLLIALAAGVFIYSSINQANAQGAGGGINPGGGGIPLPAGVPLEVGDVYGWAWTGQNIVLGSEVSEGGGGWLKLNCKPNDCGPAGATGDWGTTINLVRDQNFGNFMGQGWSSYYGWLSFEYDDVQSCWEDNSFVVSQTPAKAMLDDAGPWVDVIGWGKFIAGDVADDGWDGCVSFNGVNHDVEVNKTTGVIRGWAWGGSVTGWVSFTNPECPFCNTGIVLEGSTSIAFWADDTTNPANGSTTLRWEATNAPPNYVAQCSTYGNTSNYPHWRSTGIGSTLNVGAINTGVGNLPTGSHPIGGIVQTTTYSLTCSDRNGTILPTQYVTIDIDGPALCENPLAQNFGSPLPCKFNAGTCTDPAANNTGAPLPCTYDLCLDSDANNFGGPLPCDYDDPNPPSARLNLIATPGTLYVGSGNYLVDLNWATNPANQMDSCSGTASFITTASSIINLSAWGWDNLPPPLPNPNSSINNVNLATWASTASAGDRFVFTITCDDNGTSRSDQATVIMDDPIISFEPPVVNLRITDPNVQPPGPLREDIAPDPLAAPSDITLEWEALNVNSCVATSDIYDLAGVNAISTNSSWNGSKSDESTYTDILDMTNASVRMPTKFFITCTADDPNYTGGNFGPTQIRREVCLGLANTSFPACSVTGTGNVPSYQEI